MGKNFAYLPSDLARQTTWSALTISVAVHAPFDQGRQAKLSALSLDVCASLTTQTPRDLRNALQLFDCVE